MLKSSKEIILVSAIVLASGSLLFGTFFNDLLATEVYLFVDSKGIAHYSDKPFKQAKKIEIKVSKAPQVDERTAEQIAADKKQKRLEKQCALSKNNLAAIDANDRVIRMDVDGNEVELSPSEKAEQRAKSQLYVETYCQDIE